MPRYKVVPYPIPEVDDAWVADMCRSMGTRCEVPGCAHPATKVFLHASVAALVCDTHHQQCGIMPVAMSDRLRRALHAGLMLHSFDRMDEESGGALMRSLRDRQVKLEAQANLEKGRQKAEARQLRTLVRESGIKVGAPDDDLLVARKQNELRKKMGVPIKGRPRQENTPVRPATHPQVADDGLFPVRPIL